MIYLEGIKVAYSGLLMTLEITAVAVLIGVALGLVLALWKMSSHRVLRIIGSVYVEIIRGTPLLVQALILYSGVPWILQANGIMFTWRGIEP
ncbi:MAG: ABC transporter permease subunit, partial [Anaerovoracaceae bacterium]|nr:ABC transporter permease subunit [Anaerovoracaceae bacterium]